VFDRSQNTIFNVIEAEEERLAGMSRAADGKQSLLTLAREIACELGRSMRFVTADDVTRVLVERHRISEHALGNAAGSVFRGTMWRDTEKRVKATRVASHCRELRVWEYVGETPVCSFGFRVIRNAE
jgi:hypothetical protein